MSAATLRPRLGTVAAPRLRNITVVSVATLAMVAATAWAVMSAGWVDGTGAVLVTAVAAVLEATLIARSSVGRVVALLMLPIVGALVVVPLTYGSMPGADTLTLGAATTQYLNALTTGLFVQGDWPFLVGLCGVFWLIGSWAAWMAVRERRGVLAVVPSFAVLAVNALNAPSLRNVAVPEAVAVVLSLVVIGRVHLLALSTRWRRTGVVALPGTERRFGRVTWGAAVLLLLLALIAPPASTRDVSGSIFHFGSSNSHRAGSGGDGANTGGPGQVRFDPNAVPGGPLQSTPVSVLSYTTDAESAVYLRVVNDNYFSQGNWFPNGPSFDNGYGIGETLAINGGAVPRDRDPLVGGLGRATTLKKVTTRIILAGAAATGAGPPLGIFPGEPDSITVPGNAVGLSTGNGTALLTVDAYRLNSVVSLFSASGMVSSASANQLRTAGKGYPGFITQNYLGLNPVTSADKAQVANLVQIAQLWTAGAGNPYDAAALIESHLRDTTVFTYTLKPPATRPGLWPVMDFLQRTHAGYCQYFADAMGALLRAAGIPARLVSGYGPGTTDDSTSRTGPQLHSVTTSDAHVWVEAYFPGFGWVPFEPTPDGFYNPIVRGADPSAPSTPAPASSPTPESTPKPVTTPRPDQSGGAGGATSATVPPGLLGVVLGLVALFFAVVVLRRWLSLPGTLGGVWRRVGLLGAALGVRRRSSETYAAYARRLSVALPADTVTLIHRRGGEVGPRPVRARVVAALEQIADTSGKAEFSVGGIDEREAVQWHRAWERIRRVIPLLLWRTFLSRGLGHE
jgi:Transglutaminase-like superfamily/TgpA N-terminal domain